MSKIFKTSEDIVELAIDKFNETGLPQVGVNLKVMSITKAKQPLKISRANATTEYLIKDSDVVTLFVFEDAFDRLTDDYKEILMEGALSNVSYDTEKERIVIDNSQYGEVLRMRKKYQNYVDIVETSQLIIDDIIEEEKMKKEQEREAKKANKNK